MSDLRCHNKMSERKRHNKDTCDEEHLCKAETNTQEQNRRNVFKKEGKKKKNNYKETTIQRQKQRKFCSDNDSMKA